MSEQGITRSTQPSPDFIIRDLIVERIKQAVERAQEENVLPPADVPDVAVEHPADPQNGDFATSLPLRLARTARMNPMDIAERLLPFLDVSEQMERIWAAPPGFINFQLRDDWLQSQVNAVCQEGEAFGTLQVGKGERVMVEFVSVNPTGPVHVGHTRGAVLGSTLAAILSAAGYQVTREYYVNDAGSQMDAFYRSLYVRYKQVLGHDAELPAGGYLGDYMVDVAREIIKEHGERFLTLSEEDALGEIGAIGREKMVSIIRDDLQLIGVEFDSWFREQKLHDDGEYDTAIGLLRQGGHLSEREGALWFDSIALGEDRDSVVVRSNGSPTYFASDIAYHYNKFLQRGHQQVINIWGADHQGHVGRMKAAVAALGIDSQRLMIIISQMVTLKRGAEVVRVSKRTGDFITMRELVEEVGPDACRYFFLARAPSTQMDFDLELARKESSENPVYYVQYAHARICSILASARERDIQWDGGEVSLLIDPNELTLIRKIVLLPELIESMARTLEPHHLPHYALELATAFHWFYENCRVLSSNPADLPLSLARLKLLEASRIALSRTLTLMGMSTPERM